MSDLLHACYDEQETYQVVEKVCQKLFPQDSGCLCIMDPVEPHLKVVEFWGTPAEHAAVPPETDITDPVSTERSAALCPYQSVCSEQDCLCVPISASGEILGLLSLCFREEQGEESEDPYNDSPKAKQAILSRVAEHYALSLINLRLRETLRMESIRDPLTGLFNRRYMEESLEREARRAKRHDTSIGIIMLDIDHFKSFNDVYGHDAGDMVLQELGLFLQRNTRGEDIACRYGGEEFLLIMPEAPLDNVIQRAKDLHAGIRNLKIIYHGQPLRITVSIGVAVLPHHSSNVRELVKVADLAMYQAKRSGRDHVMVASLDNTAV
jgi:diguanylate cyclase (GGDEF)-like protein